MTFDRGGRQHPGRRGHQGHHHGHPSRVHDAGRHRDHTSEHRRSAGRLGHGARHPRRGHRPGRVLDGAADQVQDRTSRQRRRPGRPRSSSTCAATRAATPAKPRKSPASSCRAASSTSSRTPTATTTPRMSTPAGPIRACRWSSSSTMTRPARRRSWPARSRIPAGPRSSASHLRNGDGPPAVHALGRLGHHPRHRLVAHAGRPPHLRRRHQTRSDGRDVRRRGADRPDRPRDDDDLATRVVGRCGAVWRRWATSISSDPASRDPELGRRGLLSTRPPERA
jgi:hypothetical protein